MTLTFCWDSIDSRDWLRALSLPTLPWANSVLDLLGLPTVLLENLEVWNSIYTEAIVQYKREYRAKDWASLKYEGSGELLKQTVTQMLQQLSTQLGRNVALELEQWVLFHFFCLECEIAMRDWERALRCAFIDPNSRRGRKKVSLPPPLIALLPDIAELINLQRRTAIKESLEQVAPPPPYEQAEYEKLDQCYECTMLCNVIDQALTQKALQLLASQLNESERQQVSDWARTQLRVIHPYNESITSKLIGEGEYLHKYLKTELPKFNDSSLFDI